MKDNKICKGRYIPYDKEKDEVEILNATYDYVRRFGIKLNNKGNRVFNPRHIVMNNTQILINRSFFMKDLPLLEALEKIPKDSMEDGLGIVFDAIGVFLRKKDHIDWKEMIYILIDDLEKVDANSKISKTKRKSS